MSANYVDPQFVQQTVAQLRTYNPFTMMPQSAAQLGESGTAMESLPIMGFKLILRSGTSMEIQT